MRNSQRNSPLSPVKQFVALKSPFSIVMRIVIVGCSLIASVALALGLILHVHSAAHADPTLISTQVPAINQSFGSDPWDIKFDKSGHVWVAEPQCDVNVNAFPICSHTVQSGIIEYSAAGFNNGVQPLNKLVEPPGLTSPFFLAFDSSGNLWFSEPVSNSIGEYDAGGDGLWHQWAVPTPQASPLDLTFDQYGHLWFTELGASKIGEFDPGSQTFKEYSTPSANSRPYGITGPDPTTNSLWFTENNGTVHRIGQITPNSDGTIKNNHINEYLTNIFCQSSNCITPHLITYDKNGDIWWSEGYDGAIGKLVISQAADGTNNGVTEYSAPLPNCPPNSSCATHISGIGVDSSGTVWFDDALSSRYGSFTPSSSQFNIYIIGGCVTNNTHPHDGLTIDSNNNIWFSEEFANTLAEAQPGTVTNPTPCGTPTPTPSATLSPSPSPTATGTPPPTLPPGPVNKIWYFAEGRVGGGFNEYLSMDNPTSTICAVDITYLYTPDRGTPLTKTVLISIPANTRYEEGVPGDLGTSPSGHGVTDSAIVSVDNSTPACTGIVAERPMYFTALGVNSGSDVLGVTHLASTFYIGDVAVGAQPGGGSSSSFLTILNPPTGQSASVTATYYAGGVPVGTDTVPVPAGTRGTIFPNSHRPALPAHVAVVVTSTQPVAVERPTYFSHINGGNAGTVSGGADVIAVQSLSADWLFAEGYTAGQFQESFVIANLDTTANKTASVTIKLEPQNGGAPSTYTVSVPTLTTVTWNVNTQSLLPGQSLSADISSTGAQIVVEREMYFHYLHNANGRSLATTGGSDVLGEPGPAAMSSYSFAEGYVNQGFDEWVTLQNPTATTETIWLTLYNAVGHTYTTSVTLPGQSRATEDITGMVIHNLYHTGDGFKGYEVSMTVQTTATQGGPFVAERPMYISVGSIQTGTDIIGYTGQ
jgi:streptogramin lyase